MDRESGAVRFAEALGYGLAGVEHIKVLDLHALPDWRALDEEAAGLGAYRLFVCDDAVDEELLDPMCVLLTRFLGEIPLGEVDIRQAQWTRSASGTASAPRRTVRPPASPISG